MQGMSRRGRMAVLALLVSIVSALAGAGAAILVADPGAAARATTVRRLHRLGEPATTVAVTTTATTTPLASTTTTTSKPLPPGIAGVGMERAGGQLYLDGRQYHGAGFVSDSIAGSCNAGLDDGVVRSLFSQMPRGTVISVWMSQYQATNAAGVLDWQPIDRVFALAGEYGLLLAPQIEHQQGFCGDGRFKNRDWWTGGYRGVYANRDGRTPLPYWDYLQALVGRYATSSRIAWWAPVTEPQAPMVGDASPGCDEGAATAAMRTFFDTVGAEIKRLQPGTLVSMAAQEAGQQCGTKGDDYTYVAASPAVDICETRSNGDEAGNILPSTAMYGIQHCQSIEKVSIIGEDIIAAGPGCPANTPRSLAARAGDLRAHLSGVSGAGGSGILAWRLESHGPSCGVEIGPDDPFLAWVTGQTWNP